MSALAPAQSTEASVSLGHKHGSFSRKMPPGCTDFVTTFRTILPDPIWCLPTSWNWPTPPVLAAAIRSHERKPSTMLRAQPWFRLGSGSWCPRTPCYSSHRISAPAPLTGTGDRMPVAPQTLGIICWHVAAKAMLLGIRPLRLGFAAES